MAKGNIDPAFQAAPYLGDSSHDPIEFVRRHNLAKYQAAKIRQEEIRRSTAEGLDKLMIELKGWEDQEGFKEIMSDQDKVLKGFLEMSRKGMNLTSPRTSEEALAFKAITDAHERIKQKVDTWNTQKGMYDMIKKAIEVDSAKQPDDQIIDHEATMANVEKVLKTKSIFERGNSLQNLLVSRPQVGDVHKYVNENQNFITKPNKVQMPYTDPETGLQGSVLREQVTPSVEKEQIDDYKKLYTTAPDKVKAGVKKARQDDPNDDKIISDQDYFVGMYNRKFKEQLINKISGTGGGGFAINFGGQKVKMEPGKLHPEPIPYGEKIFTNSYMFPLTKPLTIPVGSGGSEQFMGQNWAPVNEGTVEATPYLYNPNTEEFVFNTTSNQNAPWVQNNKPISIPRSVIGDLADDFPIVVDGKVRKLKDVYGSMKQVKKELPGISNDFWNKPAPSMSILKNRK